MQNKSFWEGFLAALAMLLAVFAIREFFRNDRNQLVSARGKQVLNDPELMDRVNAQIKEQLKEQEAKERSGPVVVDLH